MASTIQPYEASYVHGDLSQPETLKDLFHALDHLSGTIDDIFSRIETRISEERKRVDSVNTRIAACKSKVDKVRGSRKATTVFSTAKFPAPTALPVYPTLFSHISARPSSQRETEDDLEYTMPPTSESCIGDTDLEQELMAITYRLNSHNTEMERVEFTMEDEGLGQLPPSVTSVGSLLLFNSDINPYKDYRALDNLVSTGKEKAVEEEAAKGLVSAPSSLIDGEALPDIQALDLMFKPKVTKCCKLIFISCQSAANP
jgi:WAS family protein 1